jgi:hypothetical protein
MNAYIKIIISQVIFLLTIVPQLSASSCCPNSHGSPQGSSNHQASTADQHQHAQSAKGQLRSIPLPVQMVLNHYGQIHTALSMDSLEGVSASATAIFNEARSDSSGFLPGGSIQPAEALANSQDLKTARESFKALSASLIEYVEANRHVASHVKVYCSMADARWLQTSSAIVNPYFGRSMLRCGRIEAWK